MVNWTSIKMSDLMRQKTLRMDAKYWIQKALLKKRKKELEKKKAWAGICSMHSANLWEIGVMARQIPGQANTIHKLVWPFIVRRLAPGLRK